MRSNKPIKYDILEETVISLAEANARHWEEHTGKDKEYINYCKALDDVLCSIAIKSDVTYRPVRSLINKSESTPYS